MKRMSEHTGLISSYQLLITAACTNTGSKMKGSHSRAADRCPFVLRHSLSQVTSFMQLAMLCWSLFLRVQLTIFQHCFRYWLGVFLATSHNLKQWWLVYRRIYASLGLIELNFFFINASRKHHSVCMIYNWCNKQLNTSRKGPSNFTFPRNIYPPWPLTWPKLSKLGQDV